MSSQRNITCSPQLSKECLIVFQHIVSVSCNFAVFFALIKLVSENSYGKLNVHFLYGTRNKTNKCKDELVNKVEY